MLLGVGWWPGAILWLQRRYPQFLRRGLTDYGLARLGSVQVHRWQSLILLLVGRNLKTIP